jgi:hypothetical protein
MAYCTFLKSLRTLEEFRKNLCVKIPPKSLCANFQSLGKFKNPIFILKRISLQFRPSQPSCPAGLFDLLAQPVNGSPIKGRYHAQSSSHLSPLYFSSLHARALPPPSATTAASSPLPPQSPCHRPRLGEARDGLPVQPSFRCANAGEPPWPGAPALPSSGEPPPRPCPWSTVD